MTTKRARVWLKLKLILTLLSMVIGSFTLVVALSEGYFSAEPNYRMALNLMVVACVSALILSIVAIFWDQSSALTRPTPALKIVATDREWRKIASGRMDIAVTKEHIHFKPEETVVLYRLINSGYQIVIATVTKVSHTTLGKFPGLPHGPDRIHYGPGLAAHDKVTIVVWELQLPF